MSVTELLPEEYRNNASDYQKGTDTMDVWFDSGMYMKHKEVMFCNVRLFRHILHFQYCLENKTGLICAKQIF